MYLFQIKSPNFGATKSQCDEIEFTIEILYLKLIFSMLPLYAAPMAKFIHTHVLYTNLFTVYTHTIQIKQIYRSFNAIRVRSPVKFCQCGISNRICPIFTIFCVVSAKRCSIIARVSKRSIKLTFPGPK